MAEFLVIEERSSLPQWLSHRIGTYLPIRCRDILLCSAEGKIETHHDITSVRGQKKAVTRLQEAEERGIVCAVIGNDDVRREIGRALRYPLSDGSLLCASLRLEQVISEMDCARARIALGGADSMIGRAVATYLAKRVRFLSLVGRSETALHRLAKCLWKTEGIAVTVGARSDDRVITLDELTAEADCHAEGQYISSAVAECAILASRSPRERDHLVTARTLVQTAELARASGISILPKNSASAGQIRLTNAPSENII